MTSPIYPTTTSKDSDLLSWSKNFADRISESPDEFRLTGEQAIGFAAAQEAFAQAYKIATCPTTNSSSNIVCKNEAREQMLRGPHGARELVAYIQNHPATTDAARISLGLSVPKNRRRGSGGRSAARRTQMSAPHLTVESTCGRDMRIRLRDADNWVRRGKPDGAKGATIVYYLGDDLPPTDDPSKWSFGINTSKTHCELTIAERSAREGSRVWISAFWFDHRMQAGNPAIPVSAIVGSGLTTAA